MENAAKALEMAAGVMLGVILMALVAYFFTNISSFPENEEDIMSVEQLSKFNLEYEVYNKSKMYGVDVLSCLNKVVSNNEKYAQGGAFLGGNAGLADYKQRENYWINVKLKLKDNKLKEELEVYKWDIKNREVLQPDPTDISMNDPSFKKLYDAVTSVKKEANEAKLGTKFTALDENAIVKACYNEIDVFTDSKYVVDGYVTLTYKTSAVKNGISDMNPQITNLLNSIQTLSGNQGSPNLTFVVRNTTKANYDKWTQVIWKTTLYDLKNRKFTCTDLTYNSATGRVNEIVFEEI